MNKHCYAMKTSNKIATNTVGLILKIVMQYIVKVWADIHLITKCQGILFSDIYFTAELGIWVTLLDDKLQKSICSILKHL